MGSSSSSSSITAARRKHQLLSVLLRAARSPAVQLLRQEQILGPDGLPQGVLERRAIAGGDAQWSLERCYRGTFPTVLSSSR